MTVDTILYLIAIVAFALAAAGVVIRPWLNLVALGLFCVTLAQLV